MKNLMVQAVGQFGSRILLYGFMISVARLLGTKEFGAFSYSLSIGYIVYSLMEFGQDTLIVKWVARDETEIVNTISISRAFTSIVGLIIIVIISLNFPKIEKNNMLIIGLGFFFFSIFNYCCSYLRGLERMKEEAFLLICNRGFLVLTFTSIYITWISSYSPSIAFFLSNFIASLIAIIILINSDLFCVNRTKMLDFKSIAKVLKETIPLAAASASWVIYYRIDSIMIANLKDMSSVGIYNGAYKIAEGLILVSRVIMLTVFPTLSRLGVGKNAEFFGVVKKLFMIEVIVSMIITVSMFFASTAVIKLILGPQYLECVIVLRVLLISVAAMFVGYLATQALIALDMQIIYMVIVIVGTIMNITLNIYLIPNFGATGAAIATSTTDVMITIICCFILYFASKERTKNMR